MGVGGGGGKLCVRVCVCVCVWLCVCDREGRKRERARERRGKRCEERKCIETFICLPLTAISLPHEVSASPKKKPEVTLSLSVNLAHLDMLVAWQCHMHYSTLVIILVLHCWLRSASMEARRDLQGAER